MRLLFDEVSVNWNDQKLNVKKYGHVIETIEAIGFDVNQLFIDELNAFFNFIKLDKNNYSLYFSHVVENTRLMLEMHKSAN
jgi:hypothetical protein